MIDRRRFLAIGAVAASWPLWLRRAFADASLDGPRARAASSKAFTDGLERARRLGRKLLVLVIPEDDAAKWERGRAFGEWINHGAPADVAPLAEHVVVCARVAEMGAFAPKGEPLMALVDPRAEAPARALDGKLDEYEDRRPRMAGAPPPRDDEEVFRARVDLLAGLARSTVDDPRAVAARAGALYPKVVASVKDRPPPGAHWAKTSGCCNEEVEPTDEEKEAERRAEEEARKKGIILMKTISGCGCGMGHVPEKSRRFLYFFARREG